MEQTIDYVIIGAGLTGLTTGFYLSRQNKNIIIIDTKPRIGGQIHTFTESGFTFESGPNTGVISNPEVAELFEDVNSTCHLELAREEAKRRLIWKGDRFHALPNSLVTAVTTPLFSWYDKFRILTEPFRAKGTNPDESVGEMTVRRLGRSFLDYAVDPFLSGVYAGDPMRLTTRYALPKLYRLEQDYGSFIRGSIAKAKQLKSERDKKATKKVFSAQGGLERLVEAMTATIGKSHFLLSVADTQVMPKHDGGWNVSCKNAEGKTINISAQKVITTTGAYALPALLPFVDKKLLDKVSNLYYAPIVQVSVGVKDTQGLVFNAFGGLVPTVENRNVLGILYPSACFNNRVPQGGALFSFFMGGVKHPKILQKSDEEIRSIVEREFHEMLKFPVSTQPDIIKIFRHKHAIPQYRADSGERIAAISEIQTQHPGLIIAGNLKDGIGMADRVKQARTIADKEQS